MSNRPTQQQPSPTHMSVTAAEVLVTPRSEQWSYGLCNCFDEPATCCESTLCPCVVYSQNKTRLEHLKHNDTPHPTGGDACGSDCLLHASLTVLGCFGWVLEIVNREAIRKRYGIEGGRLNDCCTVVLCLPCALTQESRQLYLEERAMRGT